jgi:hypothetical protein
MGNLRGRRRRLSRIVGTATAAGQNFRKNKDVLASAPHHWRRPDPARCQSLDCEQYADTSACDKSPQWGAHYFLGLLRWPRPAARRGSTRDLLRQDGPQAEPGRRVDLIDGGGIDTWCNKLVAAPSICGGG